MVSERGDGHTKTESEAGVMPLQATGHQGGGSPRKAEEARTESPSEFPGGSHHCPRFGFRLPASGTVREEISVVLSSPVCGHVSWQP